VRAALLGQVLQAAEIILTESSIFSPEYMLVQALTKNNGIQKKLPFPLSVMAVCAGVWTYCGRAATATDGEQWCAYLAPGTLVPKSCSLLFVVQWTLSL
jgi:hypothetical protein